MKITKDFFENLYLYDTTLVAFSLKSHYRDMLVTFFIYDKLVNLLFKGVVAYSYKSNVKLDNLSLDDIYLKEELPTQLYGSSFHWGICNNIIDNWTLEQGTELLNILSMEYGHTISRFNIMGNYGTLSIDFVDIEYSDDK